MGVEKIISGGQIGVDRVALDVARKLGIPFGGYMPKGRRAKDGKVPGRYSRYYMVELQTGGYPSRTKKNVEESDGTIIFCNGKLKSGSKLTKDYARKIGKPYFVFDLESIPQFRRQTVFNGWLNNYKVKVLNVAGPCYSDEPGNVLLIRRTMFSLLDPSFL